MLLLVGCAGTPDSGPHPAAPAARPAPHAADLAAPGRPGWTVDGASGCWLWNAAPRFDEMVTWTAVSPNGVTSASAACPDGPATGRGRAEWHWREGSRLRKASAHGLYGNGRLDGPGEAIAANGDRHEGTWRAGRPDGFGIRVFAPDADGREAVAGIPPGAWRIRVRARRYEGEWRDGKPHGQGVLVFADGARFDGEFRDGLADGPGEYASLRGPARRGVWQRGCLMTAAGAERAGADLQIGETGAICPPKPAASAGSTSPKRPGS
ncbi:hypothetical protein ACFQS7_04350 [Dankookia sp. GCM10030260]|uniref:hypothetical protein n=1 Tax=Dankookia sp. GCM10030260 TaxID=3273390 RepID=UPI003621D30A